MAYLRYYRDTVLQGLNKIMKNIARSRSFDRNSNRP